MAAPRNLREYVGPWISVHEDYWFAANDTAGTLGDVGAPVSTILIYTPVTAGFVWGYELDAIGGNLAGAVYLVNIAGSPVAAATFTADSVAKLTGTFKKETAAFAAGDAVQCELDAIGTGRITRVRLKMLLDAELKLTT